MDPSLVIGAQLRAERRRVGMDLATLEVLSELPAERLRALEDGSASPSLDELQQLAAVFGLRTSVLLERAENRAALRIV